MISKRTDVLDINCGEVLLDSYMGSDSDICRIARTSTQGQDKTKTIEENRKLLRYLWVNGHSTPFEFPQFWWRVKCPIYVARQWFRHRTFSYSEISGRYKKLDWDCHNPEEFRIQSTKNRQSSQGTLNNKELKDLYEDTTEICNKAYDTLLQGGVAREQARGVMPISQMTEFFVKTDLNNLLHFLRLRLHSHAQREIRVYAKAILDILKELQVFDDTLTIFAETRAIEDQLSSFYAENYANKDLSKFILNFTED